MSLSPPSRVLIVDDDPIVAESLAEFLATQGYEPSVALHGAEALQMLAQTDPSSMAPGTPPRETTPGAGRPARPFAVVISDVSMPGMDGLELLRHVVKRHRGTAVIMLTGYGTIESAVEALRVGACDYLTKPVVDDELRVALERAIRQQALLADQVLRQRLDDRNALGAVVGSDHRMQRIFELVRAVAPSRTTVLMTGESGTGKSLVAHAIHHLSPRASKPFVEISCGSIPETLLESELFGHVKGAFTGAHADKQGRFLAANSGTIFLDEINSASPGMQLKLLRVLQERRFEPVGSTHTVEVDVRVVLASNQALEKLVAAGQFRQDLYYRINVVKIELPPLRDRVADIPLLAETMLRRFGAELGKQLAGFSPEAMHALRRYHYPGNVRELQNVIERAAVLSQRPTIGIEDLPSNVTDPRSGDADGVEPGSGASGTDTRWTPMSLQDALRDPERRILVMALKANGWNRQRTADQLGINRTTLYKKLKAHGIDGPDEGEERRLAG